MEAAHRAGAGQTDWLDSREGYRQAMLAATAVLGEFSPSKNRAEETDFTEALLGKTVAKRLIGILTRAEHPSQIEKSWALPLQKRLGKLYERIRHPYSRMPGGSN